MTVFPILQDKVAIVTGAAMGMGAATAKLFAEAKAKVIVADFNDEKGQAVADAITAAGNEATFVHVDISKSTDVQHLVDTTVKTYGELNIAINNAALAPDQAPVDQFDESYWDRLMSVDLKGTALCLKYELQTMIKQGKGGSIVNISSVSGFRPQPNNMVYVAAKHGVRGMTKVAALENGKHNIRVNSLAPGAIDTPMLHQSLAETGQDPQQVADALSELGRFGDPREIAQGSLFLASDMASYVTGTTLAVDAGFTNM
ncbi:SDR family NAD(P)-dependent oxidoreductase [Levilactobacillus yiduensis]|uniref:SDR family NAD(P)-dependent oxidoreductase n=1 Tax=Levilactobacillus yiduensis TaxID=2953880 RepID=UPI000EF2FD70|nr:glucose 1-dehydrogenase [Levilactobacillus yiduensis]AYM01690.1 glucose 1-dehydrogenase [Levilactobacillus brevis]